MATRSWMLWFAGSAVGTALIAAPDNDDRLFSISRTHGPSLVDTLGFLVILCGWSALWVGLWKGRGLLELGAWRGVAVAVTAAAGALLTWSIVGDHGMWWMLGAGVLGAVQVLGAVIVTIRRRRALPARTK